MPVKGLVIVAVLAAMAQSAAPATAQASDRPIDRAPSSQHTTSYTYPIPAPVKPDCNGVPCDDQQPRVIVTLPAPAPTPWPWHDRILWAAYLVLAIVGYAGIMLGRSTLKRIESQSQVVEEAVRTALASATTASETAQAALLHAQALTAAERPWLIVSVEPTLGVENSFNVTATNRGRSPGRIVSAFDQSLFAADEAHLPKSPTWKSQDSGDPFVPIILLPGEFVSVKTIRREDAREICGSEEKFKSVEAWQERLYICGKVQYDDLLSPEGKQTHETTWCCWYIHGRQKSGMVIAGPAAYHAHT